MTAAGCADVRQSLGVYVLGALDPAERGRVDTHLAGCSGCRDELASLAALPGLLSRVSVAEIEAVPQAGPALLDRLLAATAAERHHDRRVRWLTSVAAAAAVVVAGSVAGVAVTTHHNATSPVAAAQISATDPATHVSAQVTEWTKRWGTALEVKVDGQALGAYGGRCQLVAVSSTGEQEVAASWTAPASGRVDASGATGLGVSEIASFKVVGSNGATLVSVPVTPQAAPSA